jgi:CubicO group peptidase (beta-lactamase class C family)
MLTVAALLIGLMGGGQFQDTLTNEFTNFARDHGAHGGAVMVVDVKHGGQATATYGTRNGTDPFTLDTPSRVASVTKIVTATAVMKLVDDGKLSLDAAVLPILNKGRERPIVPIDPRMASITVRQLLHHSGGFMADRSLLWKFPGRALRPPVPKEVLVEQAFSTQRLGYTPGTQYSYSNAGFLVLGRLIEAVSGETYADYVQKSVFAPHGISKDKAYFGTTKGGGPGESLYWDLARRVAGSLFPEDKGRLVPYPRGGAFALEEMDSYGGLVISARALSQFIVGFPKLLSPRMLAELTINPQLESGRVYTGLGFTCISEGGGGVTVFHSGSLEGCNAATMYRVTGQAIVVLFNTGSTGTNMWAGEFQDTVCNILNQLR